MLRKIRKLTIFFIQKSLESKGPGLDIVGWIHYPRDGDGEERLPLSNLDRIIRLKNLNIVNIFEFMTVVKNIPASKAIGWL